MILTCTSCNYGSLKGKVVFADAVKLGILKQEYYPCDLSGSHQGSIYERSRRGRLREGHTTAEAEVMWPQVRIESSFKKGTKKWDGVTPGTPDTQPCELDFIPVKLLVGSWSQNCKLLNLSCFKPLEYRWCLTLEARIKDLFRNYLETKNQMFIKLAEKYHNWSTLR